MEDGGEFLARERRIAGGEELCEEMILVARLQPKPQEAASRSKCVDKVHISLLLLVDCGWQCRLPGCCLSLHPASVIARFFLCNIPILRRL